MWAQLIKMRVKPGKDIAELNKQIQAAEQPGSGLVRSLMMHDQKDPSQVYGLVVFESEEKAREREQDPRCEERLQPGGIELLTWDGKHTHDLSIAALLKNTPLNFLDGRHP